MSFIIRCGVSRLKICALISAGLATLALTGPAAAQLQIDADPPASVGAPVGTPHDGWAFSLGLGAAVVPDYEGSEDYKAAPLPVARAQKGHQYGLLFGSRFSSNLIPHPNWRAGPIAEFIPKRNDVENDKVDDLSSVDAALMLGAQVGYDVHLDGGVLGAEVDWAHDVIDGNDGWLLRPRIKYRRQLAERWRINLATAATYASDDYMESYFSINGANSARQRPRHLQRRCRLQRRRCQSRLDLQFQ